MGNNIAFRKYATRTSLRIAIFVAIIFSGKLIYAQDIMPATSRFIDTLEINEKILRNDKNCEPDIPETGDAANDSDSLRLRAQKIFYRGFCLIVTSDSIQIDRTLLNSALQDLGIAQQRGLAANFRVLASFSEGLGYCRLAKSFVPTQGDTRVHPVFCTARRASLAAFDDVNWSFMKYTNTTPRFKMNILIKEMRACYANELAEEFDAACGINASLPNVTDIATDAVKAPIVTHITGASSQLQAMIARKKSISDSVMKRVDEAIGEESDEKSLKGKAKAASSRYFTLKNSVTELNEKATNLLLMYKETVREGFLVLDLYQRFESGLLRDGSIDHKLELEKNRKQFNEQLETAKRQPNRDTPSTWDMAVGASGNVSAVLNEGSLSKQAVKGLCQVYYCEMANAGSITKIKRVCASTAADMSSNPLCIESDGKQRLQGNITADGNIKNVAVICENAGLNRNFIKLNMNPFGDAKACFADFAVPR